MSEEYSDIRPRPDISNADFTIRLLRAMAEHLRRMAAGELAGNPVLYDGVPIEGWVLAMRTGESCLCSNVGFSPSEIAVAIATLIAGSLRGRNPGDRAAMSLIMIEALRPPPKPGTEET